MDSASASVNGQIPSLFMSVEEAVAWIVTRDGGFVDECSGDDVEGLRLRLLEYQRTDFFEQRIPTEWFGPLISEKKAADMLANACREGQITATGFRGSLAELSVGQREEMSSDDWLDVRFTKGQNGSYIAEPAALDAPRDLQIISTTYWRGLRFKRHDIQNIFPAWITPAQMEGKLEKGAGGRPPAYDWGLIKDFVFDLLAEHGLPQPHDPDLPNQEAVVSRVLSYCENAFRVQPGISTTRDYVRKWIREFTHQHARN